MVDGEDFLLARGWRIARPATPTPVSGARQGSPPLPEQRDVAGVEGAFTRRLHAGGRGAATNGVFAGAEPGAALDARRPRWWRARSRAPSSERESSPTWERRQPGRRPPQVLAIDVELTCRPRDPVGDWSTSTPAPWWRRGTAAPTPSSATPRRVRARHPDAAGGTAREGRRRRPGPASGPTPLDQSASASAAPGQPLTRSRRPIGPRCS